MTSKPKEITFVISSIEELDSCANKLLDLYPEHKIFTFTGNLGSGKTTFIKSIVSALQSKDSVSSPTYSIVNEYLTPNDKIFHIDLYRLESLEDALNIGMEEYLYNNQYCLIEWPDLISELLTEPYVAITITNTGNTERLLTFSEKQ